MLTKEAFLEQIDYCRSPYKFVEMAREKLKNDGFEEIYENQKWDKIPKKFFVVRDEKCIFAGKIGTTDSAIIAGGHIDFPYLKIINYKSYKNSENIDYVDCRVHGYPSLGTWVDRALGISGIVFYKDGEKIATKVIRTKEAIATIPNSPLNLSNLKLGREEFTLDKLLPILGFNEKSTDPNKKHSDILIAAICKEVGCKPEDIVDFDLNFFDINPPQIVSNDGNLISAQGLDDLSCSLSILSAFLNAKMPEKGSIFAAFMNHEEIGSNTREGVKGTLIPSVLERIGCNSPDFYRKSFFLSCDVAFGASPNYPEQVPINHECVLGDGPCIQWSESLWFATDAKAMETFNYILKIGEKEGIKVKYGKFAKMANQGGGTTIGPLLSARLGITTIDFGVPVSSMHSIRELSHFDDIFNNEKIVKLFYEHQLPKEI